MTRGPRSVRSGSALVSLLSIVVATVAVVLGSATAASAAVPPVVQRPAAGVTADPLATAQINGVVWSMATVGNTVYAGGSFTKGRPAGSAAGQNESTRNNMAAIDITTGNLLPFAPSFNGEVKAVAVSPNGQTLFVGGAFTSVDGVARYRLAAFDVATGQLIPGFAPIMGAQVNSLAVTNSTVYAGGFFTTVNGAARSRVAALATTNGALLAWAPTADSSVDALTLTPDQSRVIIGGKLTNLNGAKVYGMGSVSASTGASQPWQINAVVRDSGTKAGITSLTADNDTVYGSTYSYGGGNYEGSFAADPTTGAIKWLDDCHGDTYSTFNVSGVHYNVGHAHFCSNIGGFPETSPRTHHRAMAYTKAANGTVATNSQLGSGYGNFAGQPAPSIINWFPDFAAGTYTGASQAAWSLTGNSTYLVAGGEFPSVNGKGQQGIVRFAVPQASPNAVGPAVSGSAWPLTSTNSATAVQLSWPANWDQDDQVLSYSVFRSDAPTTPIYTSSTTSQFWNRPTMTYNDTSYQRSTSYTYTVRATDPNGNNKTTAARTVTSPSTGGGTPTNQPPVASFTSSSTGLTASFDASASTDDGTIASYSWNFGDGATGTGKTTSHPYASAGNYTVTLTVTDNLGATGQAAKVISVSPVQQGPAASDTFSRTLSGSWGSADTGGAWTTSPSSAFSVDGSVGKVSINAAGSGPTPALAGVSATNVDYTVDLSANKLPGGGGVTYLLEARKSSSGEYRMRVHLLADGSVTVSMSKLVGTTETFFPTVVTGLTNAAGTTFRLRFGVSGTGTTALTAKVWTVGTTEPAAPQQSVTDTEATLQGSGSVALQTYLSGSSTSAPVVISVDNLTVA